jgi:hypothetical protein
MARTRKTSRQSQKRAEPPYVNQFSVHQNISGGCVCHFSGWVAVSELGCWCFSDQRCGRVLASAAVQALPLGWGVAARHRRHNQRGGVGSAPSSTLPGPGMAGGGGGSDLRCETSRVRLPSPDAGRRRQRPGSFRPQARTGHRPSHPQQRSLAASCVAGGKESPLITENWWRRSGVAYPTEIFFEYKREPVVNATMSA